MELQRFTMSCSCFKVDCDANKRKTLYQTLKLPIMQNFLAIAKDSWKNVNAYVCSNSNYRIHFCIEFFFKRDDDTLKMRFRLVLDVVRNLEKES